MPNKHDPLVYSRWVSYTLSLRTRTGPRWGLEVSPGGWDTLSVPRHTTAHRGGLDRGPHMVSGFQGNQEAQ